MVSFDCQIVAEFSGNACIVNPCDAMTVNNYVYYGEKVRSVAPIKIYFFEEW